MTTFRALVTEDVEANRLLSLQGGNGTPTISIAKSGETPDFRSAGAIKADTEVTVELKNNPIWTVEAGGDLSAGQYVEVGEDGTIIASSDEGIGYVAESVLEGNIAKLVRKASGGAGARGPKGDKGDDGDQGPAGFGTEAQYNDIITRLEALEGE